MKRITLREVAKEAAVSVSTASSVINKSRFVSKDKKERVLEAIDKLSYNPNLIARSLKISSSNTIGMIFPDIENSFFISLIKKAEECAFKSGYNVILCNTNNDSEKEKQYIQLLKGKMVDGFILITSFKEKDYLEKAMAGEKVVYVDRYLGIIDEAVVKLDNVKGVRIAVKYLAGLGHKRIGYINIKPYINIGSERLEGYKKGLEESGIEFDPDLVKYSGFSIESSYKEMKELLSYENKPTAVIPVSNRITIGALKAIKNSGYKIPEDISVVGFDELVTGDLLTPPLTVVTQPAYNFGEVAIKKLIDKINGIEPDIKVINLEPILIKRDSCKRI
jgi:DNA-binding LacI/PurR family transcriptional regulator